MEKPERQIGSGASLSRHERAHESHSVRIATGHPIASPMRTIALIMTDVRRPVLRKPVIRLPLSARSISSDCSVLRSRSNAATREIATLWRLNQSSCMGRRRRPWRRRSASLGNGSLSIRSICRRSSASPPRADDSKNSSSAAHPAIKVMIRPRMIETNASRPRHRSRSSSQYLSVTLGSAQIALSCLAFSSVRHDRHAPEDLLQYATYDSMSRFVDCGAPQLFFGSFHWPTPPLTADRARRSRRFRVRRNR
jgi:hypothetical protein